MAFLMDINKLVHIQRRTSKMSRGLEDKNLAYGEYFEMLGLAQTEKSNERYAAVFKLCERQSYRRIELFSYVP